MAQAPHDRFQAKILGQSGFNVLAASDPQTGTSPEYMAIQALEDSVVTATVDCDDDDSDTSINVSILAGSVIMGVFHTLDIISGKVVAYIKENEVE